LKFQISQIEIPNSTDRKSAIRNPHSAIDKVDGILVIDKPSGWTSHDAVARVRRILRERRVGHTGTLDPFATGVLVVLVGRATRLAQFLVGAEKEYEAVVRLGYATETGDREGARRGEVKLCGAWGVGEIEEALQGLRGEIDQVPPMYSAKKVKGEKLYELARRGIEVEREAVRVMVHEIEAVENEDGARLRRNEDGTCDLSIRVVCSAGTYVRVLAEVIGERLGVGAHLRELRRTRAGVFGVGQALSLERLQELAEASAVGEVLTEMNAALSEMPAAHLTAEEARRVGHGAAVRAPRDVAAGCADGARVRLCDEEGRLLAVGVYEAVRGSVQPRVLLVGAEGAEK
jgi:tRNA pseudouridine55 synthase